MAQEKTTVARPYSEAVFGRALETDQLDLWSDMLAFLRDVVSSPQAASIFASPKLSREQSLDLALDIGGDRLNEECQNLLRLLAANDRFAVLPEISAHYERLKQDREGLIKVQVTSAYVLNKADENFLAEVLKTKLGRDIEISSEKDPSLIGGILIRAGDLVIDGSVRGQLHKLANELNI